MRLLAIEELLRKKVGDRADDILQADVSELSWIKTRVGEKTLQDNRVSAHLSNPFLHSRYSVEKELESLLEEINWEQVQHRTNVLYCFGMGCGELHTRLQDWLDKAQDRYLVFLEDDNAILRRFLETDGAEKLLRCRQTMIIDPGKTEHEMNLVAEELAYYFVQLPIFVTALASYKKGRETMFRYLQMRLMHQAAYVSYGSEEFLQYGGSFFANYYANIAKIPDSYSAKNLWGAFSGIPAIITGAGPSLNKNGGLLASLQDKALIFAGGSAMNALDHLGVQPHFGATVDPNYEQVIRVTNQNNAQIPFFYKARVHHQVLPFVHGPKVYLPGNTGYPISEWIESRLGIEQTIVQEGHNVLHMTMDLARLMGCDPIIFVGMDLAYTGLQQYASCVITDPSLSEQALIHGMGLNDNGFLRPDIYGNPVYTLWKWVAESNYTSSYVTNHPEITFLNCTEGGIGVKGVENKALELVIQEHLDKEWDLSAKIHSLLTPCRYQVTEQKICQVCHPVRQSLIRCKQVCSDLEQLFVELQEAIVAEDFSVMEQLSSVIEEKQLCLGQEIAMTQILGPVNHVRSILFERQIDETEAMDQTEQQKVLSHCKANQEEMHSLQQAAEKSLACIPSSPV